MSLFSFSFYSHVKLYPYTYEAVCELSQNKYKAEWIVNQLKNPAAWSKSLITRSGTAEHPAKRSFVLLSEGG